MDMAAEILKARMGITDDMDHAATTILCGVHGTDAGRDQDEVVLGYLRSAKRELDTITRKLTEAIAVKHQEVKP